MCNCAVNWCDKLCFFAFIFAVLLSIFVTWQGEVVNSRIVTEPTLLYFHFYLWGRWNLITNWYQSWPLGSRNVRNVTILTIQGHATSSFTWPFESQWAISDWWYIVAKSLSPAVFEIFGPKYIEVTTFTFVGHVTSSATWPFDSHVVISFRCSIGTKSVSPTIVEIMGPKYIGVMTLTFLGHVTSSVTWPFEFQRAISYW